MFRCGNLSCADFLIYCPNMGLSAKSTNFIFAIRIIFTVRVRIILTRVPLSSNFLSLNFIALPGDVLSAFGAFLQRDSKADLGFRD